MFLRFNQVLFAAAAFSIKIGLLMAIFYSVIATVGILLFSAQSFDWAIVHFVLLLAFYVMTLCGVCAFLAFSLSSFLKKAVKPKTPTHEGFWVLSLAALIANLTCILGTRSFSYYPFYLLNLAISAIGIWIGGRFYVSTFKKLQNVMNPRAVL